MDVWFPRPWFVKTGYDGRGKDFDGYVLCDDGFSIRTIVDRLVDIVCRELIAIVIARWEAWVVAIVVWRAALE